MDGVFIPTREDFEKAVKKAVSEAIQDQVPVIVREATAKEWLTKSEVMSLLGISSRSLQNLRDTGQIDYAQHGYKIFYPREGIMRFLKDHEIKAKR